MQTFCHYIWVILLCINTSDTIYSFLMVQIMEQLDMTELNYP